MLVCRGWLRGREMLDGCCDFPNPPTQGEFGGVNGDFDGIHGVLFSIIIIFTFSRGKARSDFRLDARGGKRPGGKCNVHCYIKDKKTKEREGLPARSSSPIQSTSKYVKAIKLRINLWAHMRLYTKDRRGKEKKNNF